MDRNNTGTMPLTNEPRTAPPSYQSQATLSDSDEQRTTVPAPVHTSSVSSVFQTNMPYLHETQNTSSPCELSYSVPNTRPPGTTVNQVSEPVSTYSVKYVDPPSYEEAIKAMHYSPPEEPDHLRHNRYPDQGQFSTSEPYFYHQTYNNELDTELAKSFCSRIVFAIIMFAVAGSVIRVLYFTS